MSIFQALSVSCSPPDGFVQPPSHVTWGLPASCCSGFATNALVFKPPLILGVVFTLWVEWRTELGWQSPVRGVSSLCESSSCRVAVAVEWQRKNSSHSGFSLVCSAAQGLLGENTSPRGPHHVACVVRGFVGPRAP